MRSRAGEHFFLASDVPIPANNGAVLNIANLIKTVMSSAAKAEMGAIFLNVFSVGEACSEAMALKAVNIVPSTARP